MATATTLALPKAVNAARMAMSETGGHKVSLDQIIRTMYEAGAGYPESGFIATL